MFTRKKAAPTAQVTDTTPIPAATKKKRPFLIRLLSLKFWGAMRLTAICIAVGIFINLSRAANDPASFDFFGAIKTIWEDAFGLLIWVVQHGWQPALIGATVVLPIWIVWRILTFPFRR